jgi:hypothetical protein
MFLMRKLAISPKYTIEDIHKIREWNYERRKNMSPREIVEDTKAGAKQFMSLVATMRTKTKAA